MFWGSVTNKSNINTIIMHTKHYLTTILIFATILLFCFSVQSQNSSDTIRMVKKVGNYKCYRNNERLSMSQLMYITQNNEKAYRYIIKANNLRFTSQLLGVVGGGCFGYSLGYVIGRSIADYPIEIKKIVPFLLVGSGTVIFSITFWAISNENLRKGLDIYNHSIKQKNNPQFNLGFSPYGTTLQINF